MSVVFQLSLDAVVFLVWMMVLVYSVQTLAKGRRRPLVALASGLVTLAVGAVVMVTGMELIPSLTAFLQGGQASRTAWEWGQGGILLVSGLVLLALMARSQTRDSFQRITSVDHLTRLHCFWSLCSRAINQGQESRELLQKICEVAVDQGGFLRAEVAQVQEGQVLLLCHASQASPNRSEEGQGHDGAELSEPARKLMMQAAAERRVVHSRDLSESSLHKLLQDIGVRSVAVIPLIANNEAHGVLVLYSSQAGAFEDEQLSLLARMGEDLGNAITHIDREQERLRSRAQLSKLSQAVEQSADAVMIMSTAGLIEYVNPRFVELTGYSRDEVIGREADFLCVSQREAERFRSVLADLKKGCCWKGEFRNRAKSGELYWSMDTLSPICDDEGRVTHFVSTSEDCTELRKAQDTIEQLAFYDSLTDLPNRRLMIDRIQNAIEVARRNGSQVVLMYMDLDKFKSINDSLGHRVGDELLKEVSKRLRESVRPQDTVARFGGDEFTLLLTGITELSDVIMMAERILEKVQQPIQINGQQLSVTTSLGITIFPGDGEDSETLLRNADLAMYHAKGLGRNNFQFYTDEIHQRALNQVDMERQLRQAIETEQFVLYYQPQIDLMTGQIVGVEALVRWINDRGDIVPPDVFIPLAEETGLIEPLGTWVLRKALQEMQLLQDKLGYPVKVAVNLSAIQFRRADHLKQTVRQALEDMGADPALLELELTESMLVDNVQTTIETLHDLRELGISLAIDDFGIGYSSLNYLKRFPIDILKIDRSFVRDIETNPSDAAITAAIVALGHELKLKVVAEGVENKAQLEFLQKHGCDFYQGYFFSAPVPLEKLTGLFTQGPIGIVQGRSN